MNSITENMLSAIISETQLLQSQYLFRICYASLQMSDRYDSHVILMHASCCKPQKCVLITLRFT